VRSPVNWQKSSLSFSRTTLSHTEPATLVSGAGNTRVYITRSDSPELSLVAYTICGIIDVSAGRLIRTEHITASAVIMSGALHKVVATLIRCGANFLYVSLEISLLFLTVENRLGFGKVDEIQHHLFETPCMSIQVSACLCCTANEILVALNCRLQAKNVLLS